VLLLSCQNDLKIAQNDTDITDEQWKLLKKELPTPSKMGRPPTDRRVVIDAIFYVLKGGIQWRLFPESFPAWKAVYDIFRQWSRDHTLERLNGVLRNKVRAQADKRGQPPAAILDSQSVKSDSHGGEVGYDAGKRIKGRKRHILVDTLGLLLGVAITPANMPERAGARTLLARILKTFTWLRKVWVDGGYTGQEFAQWVKGQRPNLEVEVVKRSDDVIGFEVLPRRWVVERTIGWLMRHRRLVRDYEKTETSAAAWVYLAMIRIQLRRLA
jgi:transposase